MTTRKKLYGNFLPSSALFFFFNSGRILVVEEGTRTKPCCVSAAPQRIDSQIFPPTFLFSLLYSEFILTRVSSPIFLSGFEQSKCARGQPMYQVLLGACSLPGELETSGQMEKPPPFTSLQQPGFIPCPVMHKGCCFPGLKMSAWG